MTDRLGEALARMDQMASVFVDPTKGHIQQVAAAARNWQTLTRLIAALRESTDPALALGVWALLDALTVTAEEEK